MNNNLADAVPIAALPFTSDSVSNVAYDDESGESTSTSGFRTAWWSYTPADDRTIDLKTQHSSTGADTILTVWTASGTPTIGSLTMVARNDDTTTDSGVWSRIGSLAVTAGTTYYIAVGAYNDEDLTYVLQVADSITAAPTPGPGDYVKYDPSLFVLERAQRVSAKLGEFILGVSKLGDPSASAWVVVPSATFSMSEGYTVNQDGTLIVEADSATVSLSFWDVLGDVLYPSDRIRASYNGEVLFLGTVDSTSVTYAADPTAVRYGKHRRVDFSATVVGSYAAMMGKQVCWTALPAEPPLRRIRRWVTVTGHTTGLAT